MASYGKTWREVLERDGYRCQYPGCSARKHLHVHHIEYRSRSSKKSRAKSNSHPNLCCLCAFHHREVHAGVIGLKGRAPSELEWRRPELMEKVFRRHAKRAAGTERVAAEANGAIDGLLDLVPAPAAV